METIVQRLAKGSMTINHVRKEEVGIQYSQAMMKNVAQIVITGLRDLRDLRDLTNQEKLIAIHQNRWTAFRIMDRRIEP